VRLRSPRSTGRMEEVPLRRKATQRSQRTAANMGRERIFFIVFIQAPDLGRKESRDGK